MFHRARIELTLWYILIIMLVSSLFSVAFYHASTREIRFLVARFEEDQNMKFISPDNEWGPPPHLPLELLRESQERLKVTLVVINGVILLLCGGAAYFLAGRTLHPIQKMVDDQTKFISDASHELRTPLAVLRAEMEASLLESSISDRKARGLITSNLEEVETLQNLANSLLRIAHVHSFGKSSLFETVSLVDIVSLAKKKVSSLAKKKRITISEELSETLIKGEKSRLVELFVILLDNAIKYSPERTTITLSMKKKQNTVSVSVSDQGIGIAKEDLPHLFKRFYRGDKSRGKIDGFGLGLSIAEQIVHAHKGEITIVSKEKKGTTVTISFPALSA